MSLDKLISEMIKIKSVLEEMQEIFGSLVEDAENLIEEERLKIIENDTESDRVHLKWNDKEKDWLFDFPDSEGRTMTGLFFDMVKIDKNRLPFDCGLKKMLTDRGYDYKTFRIMCNKIKEEEDEM